MVVRGDVADAHALQDLGFRAGTDVDPDLVFLGHFLAILLVHEVNGSLAGHALDRTLSSLNDHAPTGYHAEIVPTDGVEIDEAVLVDVGDDEAEFVHVTGEHEHGIPTWVERGNPVAQRVPRVGIGDGLNVAIEDGLSFRFIARRRAGV